MVSHVAQSRAEYTTLKIVIFMVAGSNPVMGAKLIERKKNELRTN